MILDGKEREIANYFKSHLNKLKLGSHKKAQTLLAEFYESFFKGFPRPLANKDRIYKYAILVENDFVIFFPIETEIDEPIIFVMTLNFDDKRKLQRLYYTGLTEGAYERLLTLMCDSGHRDDRSLAEYQVLEFVHFFDKTTSEIDIIPVERKYIRNIKSNLRKSPPLTSPREIRHIINDPFYSSKIVFLV